MVTQRCALTVQLQPFMTHIPGLVASTMHGRNARYHRNTEHTIARSHLISPSRALNTLRLTLIATISDRVVRSSPADQRRSFASLITIRSLALQNDALAQSRNSYRFILSIVRHCAREYHLYSLFTCDFHLRSIPHADGEREVHLLLLSIRNDRHSTLHRRNWRLSGLSRYARGQLVTEEEEVEEVVGRLKGRLTRSCRRLLLNCCGRWHARSVSAPHHRFMSLDSPCHSLSLSLSMRSLSLSLFREDERQARTRHQA